MINFNVMGSMGSSTKKDKKKNNEQKIEEDNYEKLKQMEKEKPPQQDPSEHLLVQQDPSFTSTPASLATSFSAVARSISASLLEML